MNEYNYEKMNQYLGPQSTFDVIKELDDMHSKAEQNLKKFTKIADNVGEDYLYQSIEIFKHTLWLTDYIKQYIVERLIVDDDLVEITSKSPSEGEKCCYCNGTLKPNQVMGIGTNGRKVLFTFDSSGFHEEEPKTDG